MKDLQQIKVSLIEQLGMQSGLLVAKIKIVENLMSSFDQ